MIDFNKLRERYQTEAAFNHAVNLFKQLIEKYGFLPSELREAAFLAQFMFETGHAERIIRTNEEWEQVEEMRKILKRAVFEISDISCIKNIGGKDDS